MTRTGIHDFTQSGATPVIDRPRGLKPAARRWRTISHGRVAMSLAVAALFGFALAAPAEATVLFSNLGTPDSFDPGLAFNIIGAPGGDVDWASSFTFSTPARMFALDSIDVAVRLNTGPDDTLEVWLMSDVGGLPGTVLEVMTISAVSAAASVRTATSTSNPVLEPNITYWVALSVPGNATIPWHQNNNGDVGTMATRSGGVGWISFPTNRGAFRVNAVVVPEMFKNLPRVTGSGGNHAFSANYTYVATTGIALATSHLESPVPFEAPSSANYTMASGYWHVAESPVLPDGDLNLDELADGRDIQAFVDEGLLGVAGNPFLIPHADFNCDGVLDTLDIPQFVDRLLRGLLPGAVNTVFPVPGSTGVNIDADLSWIAGAGAVSFDVYLDPTEAAVLIATPASKVFKGNTTATTFEPGQFFTSTTFFWRIDTLGESGITKGVVWTFTTAP